MGQVPLYPCRMFRKSLGCSVQKLDYTCHLLSDKISERNYQLYLLETMFKSTAETVLNMKKDELEIAEKGVKVEESEEIRVETNREVREVEKMDREEMIPMAATVPQLQDFELNDQKRQLEAFYMGCIEA